MKIRNSLKTLPHRTEFNQRHVFLVWLHQDFYPFYKPVKSKYFLQWTLIAVFFLDRWYVQSFRWRIDRNWTFWSESKIIQQLPVVGIFEVDRLAVLEWLLLIFFRIEAIVEIEIVFTEIQSRKVVNSYSCKITRSEFDENFLFFWHNWFNVSEVAKQVINLSQCHLLFYVIADNWVIVQRADLELYVW